MTSDSEDSSVTGAPQPRKVAVHGYFIPAEIPSAEERIGVREIWAKILKHRIVFGISVVLTAAAAVVWAQSASPVYRASALVKVVEQSDRTGDLSGLMSQFGGLAALAGLRLPGGTSRAEAVAVLQSGSLAEQFIREHQLMPLLFAGKWDDKRGAWRTSAGDKPSMADAVKRFGEKVRTIQEDKLTGLVRISIRWRDPVVAADWANELVTLANERMRKRAVDEANRSLAFLQRELEKTNNIELQQAIYRLMQEQLNSATLASVRTEYALQTIDAARAPDPDDYVWPRPAVLLVIGIIVGVLFGAVAALCLERPWRRG